MRRCSVGIGAGVCRARPIARSCPRVVGDSGGLERPSRGVDGGPLSGFKIDASVDCSLLSRAPRLWRGARCHCGLEGPCRSRPGRAPLWEHDVGRRPRAIRLAPFAFERAVSTSSSGHFSGTGVPPCSTIEWRPRHRRCRTSALHGIGSAEASPWCNRPHQCRLCRLSRGLAPCKTPTDGRVGKTSTEGRPLHVYSRALLLIRVWGST